MNPSTTTATESAQPQASAQPAVAYEGTPTPGYIPWATDRDGNPYILF